MPTEEPYGGPDERRRYLRMLERISLAHPIFDSVSFHFHEAIGMNGITMDIDANVPDRETGKRIALLSRHTWATRELRDMPFDRLVYVVHNKIREVLIHELDEMFRVDGRQRHDPHEGEERR